MSYGHDPVPELTTTKTGGRSARLVAVVMAVVLGAVVYVGISGREPNLPPRGQATSRPVAAAATSAATPAPPTETPPASGSRAVLDPYPGATAVVNMGPREPSSTFGLALTVGGKLTLSQLDRSTPRHYRALYVVPLPVPETFAKLELLNVAYWPPADSPYDSWSLAAAELNGGESDISLLVDQVRPPRPRDLTSAPELIHNGYYIVVTAEREENVALVSVDLTLGSEPVYPNESYDVVGLSGGRVFEPEIESDEPGLLAGRINFGKRLDADHVSIVLSAHLPNDRYPGTVVVRTFEMPLFQLGTYNVDDPEAPDERGANLIGMIANGYHWTSVLTRFDERVTLDFELTINPNVDSSLFAPYSLTGIGPSGS